MFLVTTGQRPCGAGGSKVRSGAGCKGGRMSQRISYPEGGSKITIKDGKLQVPDNPIIGYVEGDGIGPDITRACMRIWNAAVEKAYGGKRKIHWAELYMGEKAARLYDGDYFPEETKDALKDLLVSIK